MAVTVYLRKGAGALRVARGPWAVTLEPGAYTDVPDALLDAVIASGATRRARPTGRDDTDSADDGAEEE